jgi:ribulose kinase
MTGSLRNALLIRLYADMTGCTVVQPAGEDAVLLGTAMVAATAAGLFPGLQSPPQRWPRTAR